MFDCIWLVFYSSVRHNGDVSPKCYEKKVYISLVVVERTDSFMDRTNIELWFVELRVISYSLNTQCSVLIVYACFVITYIQMTATVRASQSTHSPKFVISLMLLATSVNICINWPIFPLNVVCNAPIYRSEDSYRLWCVWVRSRSTSVEEA